VERTTTSSIETISVHAVANGIEATFSRNRFIANRIEDSWHGVWGGYSYDSVWQENRFARNAEGIAIEHGQRNTIDAIPSTVTKSGFGCGRTHRKIRTGDIRRIARRRARLRDLSKHVPQQQNGAADQRHRRCERGLHHVRERRAKLALEGATPGVSVDTATQPPAFMKPEDTEPLLGGWTQ
jgi:hypothetical protein